MFFAEVEQAIIDRLIAKMPAGTAVLPVRELERVPELRQKAPAVFVVFDGYSVGESIGPTGQIQRVTMEWYVVAMAKSARGNGNTDAARDEASALCEQVLQALLGFDVGSASGQGGKFLRLSDAPGPEYDGGMCYVPLAFTNPATFKGQP
ncbi:MAG: hypothetical protein AB7P94_16835 [Steroidobacteraceae bacterium]